MPSRTIYINYELNGLPLNAYAVELASEDGTYAIKEFDTGTITKISGQVVENPAVGRYEYTFSADDTKIYLVSWKITANPGDTPVYSVQQAGPFTTNSGRIRASSDYKGSFIQGTSAVLMLKITDFDGIPQDATIINVTIQDTSGSLVETDTPEKAVTGFYVYEWDIGAAQAAGDYVVTWEYTIDGVERAEVQTVTVATDVTDTDMYSGRPYEIRLGLESYLTCAQCVPVYFEQCKTTVDNRTYRFTFPRWNQTAGVKIYRNQNKLMTDGFTVDYFKGEVIFDASLTDFDSINADYNFRWFSDEDLHMYLTNAARTFNTYPPMGSYSLSNIPDRYIPTIQKQAATDALRHIMLCLQFQEPQKVFGGAEQADKVFGNLETIKKNYEEELKVVYEQKKNQPYVGLTRAVVVPEYTLPGGRSLVLSTQGLMKIGSSLYRITLGELYEICRGNDLEVQVLSECPTTGELVFAPIKYIWVSGIKKVYELLTKSGHSIASSDEHLFYANGKYQPLMDLKEGDEITVHEGNKKIRTIVKRVTEYRRPEKMYDLEVSETANLFANGIKCHNSRWFRYLFSGGS